MPENYASKTVELTIGELAELVVLSERSAKLNEHRDAIGSNLSYGYLAAHIQKMILDTNKKIENIYERHGIDIEELFELQNGIYNELNS